jgi:hypothetical protein
MLCSSLGYDSGCGAITLILSPRLMGRLSWGGPSYCSTASSEAASMNSLREGRLILTLRPTRADLISPLLTRRQSDVCDKPLNLSASGYETHSSATCSVSNFSPFILGVYERSGKEYN